MIKTYNRKAALDYAAKWSLSRNPAYYDFSDIGGDCTNFISQCLLAGGGVMNYTPVTGWFYINSYNRSAAWTGAIFLYRFLIHNHTQGPFAEEVADSSLLLPGDIIQFAYAGRDWHHSLLVLKTGEDYNEILIATHSYDAYLRPLSHYDFMKVRFLHIKGIYV